MVLARALIREWWFGYALAVLAIEELLYLGHHGDWAQYTPIAVILTWGLIIDPYLKNHPKKAAV